jgi:pilus assembly protein Flp/PilA
VNISFRRLFTKLLKDESGQDLIEYALIAALIGLGAAATVKSLATAISGAFTTLGSRLTESV